MKTTLVFDTFISGHHLEYIHHLYENVSYKERYIFIVPASFKRVRNEMIWTKKTNVHFDYLSDSFSDFVNNVSHLKKSIELSFILKKYYQIYIPDKILLISLIDYYPFLPFFFRKSKVKISGIIYKIYLYEWKKYTLFQKFYEFLRQVSMVYSKCTHKIFILNDSSASCFLNKLWKTYKYCYLIDPYMPIDTNHMDGILKEYNIQDSDIVYLHWGAMDKRKGTLEILDAIKLLERDENRVFIFAGKISINIVEEFYKKYEVLKAKHKILVIDMFCGYDLIKALNGRSNYVLLPYKKTSLSSGALYYAAQLKKTVIGPKDGLVGKLIRKNRLGYCLPLVTAKEIANAIDICDLNNTHPRDSFLLNSTIDNFNKIIDENI